MNIYALMRRWWDWAYKNPSKVKPIHSALYFLMIDHCNRMGWKRECGFPTVMAMDALGVSSFNTYKNALNDLVEFGYVVMIERSKNQYSANIIALSYFDEAYDKAPDEALDKALLKHGTKHSQSTVQSIVSIDIQEYNTTNEQMNKEEKRKRFVKPTLDEVKTEMQNDIEAERFFDYYESNGWRVSKNPMIDWRASIRNWKRNKMVFNTKGEISNQAVVARAPKPIQVDSNGRRIYGDE
jgi:hypothetical protein